MSTLYFDMDGTLANFYGVENWLDYLQKGDVYPYENAKTLIHFSTFCQTFESDSKKRLQTRNLLMAV